MKLVRDGDSENQHSPQGSHTTWNNMLQYRFTSGEIRTMQLGVVTILFSVLLFAFLSNTMLLPALKSRKLRETECTVAYSELFRMPLRGKRSDNRCDESSYICLRVVVDYKIVATKYDLLPSTQRLPGRMTRRSDGAEIKIDSDSIGANEKALANQGEYATMRAILHYDELQFASLENAECTITPACFGDPDLNRRHMTAARTSFGNPGTRFRCFYDPRDFTCVISRKKFSSRTIFNCLFWPGACLAMGILIIVVVYCCIGHFKSKIGAPEKVTSAIQAQRSARLPRQHRPHDNASTSKQKVAGLGMAKFTAI